MIHTKTFPSMQLVVVVPRENGNMHIIKKIGLTQITTNVLKSEQGEVLTINPF